MMDKEDLITVIGFLGLGVLFFIGMCLVSNTFGVPIIFVW